LAQFQYNKLKLQINPHFLFNSLNILDFLVQEHETERASAFIRKLADTYRSMLKNEDETLVPLEEELTFARKYIELLKERFTTGFEVKCDIPDALLHRHVVPCCLQLLIENATKHNIVSPEHPLVVTIHIEEELLIVSNNLQPRLSKQNSTGMGLKNICQQYADLDSRPVEIIQTESEFIVQLPLL
ncbi:MAG: histidine kinase, partial [Alistipes sp.]|nr:histidine kinase [Alistipes sp.]